MKRRLRELGGWVLVVLAAGLVFWAGWLLQPDDLTSLAAPNHEHETGLPCAFCEACSIKDHDERVRVYDAAMERRKAVLKARQAR